MNNLSFSTKFSPQHDNGERTLCWRVGKPNENGLFLFTLKRDNEIYVREMFYDTTLRMEGEDCEIIAYMKFPTPYKPN